MLTPPRNAPQKTARPGFVPAPAAHKTIRVILADDHPVVRRGISACLSRTESISVVAEARDGHEALHLTRDLNPDVLVLDISMPRLNGLAVTEAVLKERPRVKVLILSAHQTAEIVLRILRAGASGYALKEGPSEDIIEAIERVHSGQLYFSPQVAHVALNQFVRRSSCSASASELSNREREILTHIAEGLSNKEIADRLSIGTRTVETHRERLMRKLEIRSVAGLTKFAIVNGFIPVPELAI